MRNRAWRQWAESLRCNTYALYLAARDPGVPALAKVIIGLVVAYALSPIDLIPDFIPVIGYLDDLVLLPLGIWMAMRLVPEEVWKACQARATQEVPKLSCNRVAAAVIVLIWVVVAAACLLWAWQLLNDSGGA